MWILTSKKTGTIYYLLPENPKYTVGRCGTDLILKNDTSVSRSHATLFPSKTTVKIVDNGSRYGTYCNESIENKVRIKESEEFQLKNGERVQFGIQGNEWIVSKLNICTLISTLSSEGLQKLQQIMNVIDGQIIEQWQDSCTHLTMEKITVTLKVLRALVENIPIVTCNYWYVYYENLKNGKPPPKCEDHLPELAETFLNKEKVSFGLNERRKKVFLGKIFYFLDKTLCDTYSPIILCAGGECEILNENLPKTSLLKKNVIVVQEPLLNRTELSGKYNVIEEFIVKNNRRLIPDFEIGLAIIYCSTEKHCNPLHKVFSNFVQTSSSTKNIVVDDILALETPANEIIPNSMSKDYEIPETNELCATEKLDIRPISNSMIGKQISSNIHEIMEPMEFNIEKEINQGIKRKRLSTSNEDVELRIIKKPNVSKENPKQSDSHNSQTLKLDGFLNKSQLQQKRAQSSVTEENPSLHSITSTSSKSSNPRKRGKVAMIGDNDDDDGDDDLFNFGSTTKKKSKTSILPLQNDDDYDEDNNNDLFNCKNVEENRKNSQNTLLKKQNPTVTVEKSTSQNIQRVNKPIIFNSSEWLSKSICKIKFKSENDIKQEECDDEDKKSNSMMSSSNWVSALGGGFEVHERKMNLTSRSYQSTSSNSGSSSTSDNSTTKKNFKAFKKVMNYKPQTQIIRTVPFQVNSSI